MSTADVSLIIPSYNRGARIRPTLESVRRQSVLPREILVVNDGGCEETRDVVSHDFPEVRVIDCAQGGAASARNLGARQASQPLLMLLDDDDTLRPDATKVLREAMTAFPQAVAAYGDHAFADLVTGERRANHFHEAGWYARLWNTPAIERRGDVRLYGRPLHVTLLDGNLLGQPWMVRRDTYLAVGGFESGLGSADDWDLYLRITRRYPIVIADAVISDHFREVGRQHLTTAPDQSAFQTKVIKRQLALAGTTDVRAQVTLRRRMGLHHKTLGDAARPQSLTGAAREYRQAAMWYPADHVVLARALWYSLKASLTTKSGARQ